MATGKAHALATVIAGGVAAPALVLLAHVPAGEGAAFAVGCLAGLLVNPDLDLRRFTHAEQVVRDSTGPLGRFFAGLWYAFWWPYARLIPSHRHPLSHFPLLGTLLRLLYLGLVLSGFYLLARLVINTLPPLAALAPALLQPAAAWAAAGLALVDALHALMDWM